MAINRLVLQPAKFTCLVLLWWGTHLSSADEKDLFKRFSGSPGERRTVRYEVPRLGATQYSAGKETSLTIDADWNKVAWQNVKPLELTHFMGERPQHFPRTQAKLLYDDEAIYVIFRVEDRYVRAVTEQHQGNVFMDSCAEFFFIPAQDHTTGYFNLEMNCGGTMLLHYQDVPREEPVEFTSKELAQINVAHSQPKIVDPEITAPTLWYVEYRLPIKLLKKYCPTAVSPAPGVQWRANFYKCADATSHPHWLTWAKVDNPHPDFHIPKFFGQLEFQ